MKKEETARSFWSRVDDLWGGKPLKDLASDCQVDYVLFLNWRTKHRLPDLVSACNIAHVLDTCTEYLTFGHRNMDNGVPRDVFQKLKTASSEDLELVRRVLRMPPSVSDQRRNA